MKSWIFAAFALIALSLPAAAEIAPAGSYQKTCSNISYNGTTLTASCTTMNGSQESASLAYPSSCVGDIGNINGVLACTGPNGSYALTCSGISVTGSTLNASCKTLNGAMVPASLPNFQGFQGNVTNCNGKLQNGGSCN